MSVHTPLETTLSLPQGLKLKGFLQVPEHAAGLVLFVHGSGSSRFSSRNRQVADFLVGSGFATLLMDLLTPAEEEIDAVTRQLRFDIPLLAQRVGGTLAWLATNTAVQQLPVGLFGASTGAAAALIAAADQPERVAAVVSRGGRPDLAEQALPSVRAPTLLIVGGNDTEVLGLNRSAMRQMRTETRLVTVPGATHLFEEPGALAQVAQFAADWFAAHLRR
jgi:putative phosphoribosyl transferase